VREEKKYPLFLFRTSNDNKGLKPFKERIQKRVPDSRRDSITYAPHWSSLLDFLSFLALSVRVVVWKAS